MINLLQRQQYTPDPYGGAHELPDDQLMIDGKLFKRVTRVIGDPYTDYEPVDPAPAGHIGWMYDGATVFVNDVEFKIRSRAETQEEYDALSR